MKKTLLAAMALLALAGCSAPSTTSAAGSQPPPAPTTPAPTVTVTVEATEATTSSASSVAVGTRAEKLEQVYLSSLRDGEPKLNLADDQSLITIGKGYCMMYDGGATVSQVNESILSVAGIEYTLNELVAMHGAGVGAFCPEHIDKI